MTATTDDFVALFDGNRNAVGQEDGGCLRVAHPDSWRNALANHLERGGDLACGVYPLVPLAPPGQPKVWRVHWGCVDFDEGEEESWVHARNLTRVLSKVGVTGWIERSRSKGYHVWVFHHRGSWLPAATVRRGLLVACQIAGAPTKEINPKSEGFENPNTLGNYVRLPYPGWLDRDVPEFNRRVMVTKNGNHIGLHDFVTAAHNAAGLDGLSTLADLWKPPSTRVDVPADMELPEELDPLIAKMSPLARTILVNGPLEGTDRSGTLYKLARKLYEDGQHRFVEVIALVAEADRRWGKFYKRPDAERRIRDIVERAWG